MSIGKYRHIYNEYLRTKPRVVHLVFALLDEQRSPNDIYEYMKGFDEDIAIDGYLIAKFIQAASVEP